MLRMENVTKRYKHRGQPVTALDGANLTIGQGDFVAVVGPSGSGKSTLLLMLGGMLSPSSGRVTFEGQSIYDLNADSRAGLRKKKGGFARLPANEPAVILADEPTGNLDPETTRQVIGFFEEVNREGKTVVMVT